MMTQHKKWLLGQHYEFPQCGIIVKIINKQGQHYEFPQCGIIVKIINKQFTPGSLASWQTDPRASSR
jgi:hypothetical protein